METSELIRRRLLRGTRPVAPPGASRVSPRRGEGYEFAELRAYVAGDDPRRIDWAATARAGALQSRVMLDEQGLVLAAIVDDSPSMQLGRRRASLEVALETLPFWYRAAQGGDRCLRLAGGYHLETRRIDARSLAHLTARGDPPTPDPLEALRYAEQLLPRGSALMVVTDALGLLDADPLPVDIEHLLYRIGQRCDAALLLARDPWHGEMPLRGMVRLRDSELGTRRRFFFGRRERERYRAAVLAREHRVIAHAERAGWRVGLLEDAAEAALRSLFAR